MWSSYEHTHTYFCVCLHSKCHIICPQSEPSKFHWTVESDHQAILNSLTFPLWSTGSSLRLWSSCQVEFCTWLIFPVSFHSLLWLDKFNVFSITGINYILKYIQIKIDQIKNSQYYCFDYFWSNKCSLGEHKRLLSKTLRNRTSPSFWGFILRWCQKAEKY